MEPSARFPNDANRGANELRHYLRLPATEASITDAELFFGDDQHCPARILNVSACGLLCRLPETGPLPSIHDAIDPLLLFRDGREPIRLAGTVKRMEYRAGDMSCAIQFSDTLPLRDKSTEHRKKSSADFPSPEQPKLMATRISAENFIGRLYTAPAVSSVQGRSWAEWQQLIEDSFRDVIGKLRDTERWWLVHIIEVLKESEPDYPEILLEEYIRLCKKGLGNNRSQRVG